MHRINTPTALPDKFGQGKNGYTDGDPATGRRATDLNASMFDSFQEEICNVIEAGGITLDQNKRDQLRTAIQSLVEHTVEETALLITKNLKEIADSGSDAQKDARANIGLANVQNHRSVQNGGIDSTSVNQQTKLGWSTGGKLLAQVDDLSLGALFYERNPPTALQVGALPNSGGAVTGNFSVRGTDYLRKEGVIEPGDGRRLTQGVVIVGVGDQYAQSYFEEYIGQYAQLVIRMQSGGRTNHLIMRNDGNFFINSSLNLAGNLSCNWGGQSANFQNNGDIVGGVWGGSLASWLGSAKVNDVRLAGRTQFGGWDGMCEAPASCVVVGIGDFGASNGYGQYAVLQRFINNGWYNVGHA